MCTQRVWTIPTDFPSGRKKGSSAFFNQLLEGMKSASKIARNSLAVCSIPFRNAPALYSDRTESMNQGDSPPAGFPIFHLRFRLRSGPVGGIVQYLDD